MAIKGIGLSSHISGDLKRFRLLLCAAVSTQQLCVHPWTSCLECCTPSVAPVQGWGAPHPQNTWVLLAHWWAVLLHLCHPLPHSASPASFPSSQQDAKPANPHSPTNHTTTTDPNPTGDASSSEELELSCRNKHQNKWIWIHHTLCCPFTPTTTAKKKPESWSAAVNVQNYTSQQRQIEKDNIFYLEQLLRTEEILWESLCFHSLPAL